MWNMFGHGFCWIPAKGDDFEYNFEWNKRFKCVPLLFGNFYITRTQWPTNKISIG